jgi:hypothetical protein
LIAKVIPAKAGGRTFGGLVDYVTAENRLDRPKGREFDELVRYVGREDTVDPMTDEVTAKAIAIETQGVASLRTAAVEMEAVAAQCRRLRAAADYHLVISWHEYEHPTPEQAFAAGRHALAALGMESHQYVMAVHGDTANVHLHVAVNRVDPESYRAVSPFRDYIKLDRAMREIELAQGWSHDRGPSQVREIDGREAVVLAFKEQTHGRGLDEPAPTQQKARDLASWSGDRPFTEWVREAAPALKETLGREGARLEEVQRTLADFGLELRRKGSGLVVVHHNDPQLVAKASQVARFLSREQLEQRVGPLDERVPAFRSPERQNTERAPEIVRETPAKDVTSPATGERDRDRDEELRRRRAFDEQRIERDAARDRVRAQPARESQSEREPKRDYKRDPERRADQREARRHERERLYAEFRAERSRGDERRATWDEQRASERARFAEITARKVEYRRELRETGLAPQIATSLAAFRAAQERVDLRDAIANERAALKRELHLEQRQAWREFVTDRAHAGDDAAISALRGLRYREQRGERGHEMETPDFALRGAGDAEPRFMRDLRDVDARVERNGDVSYRWRGGGEAFRDRGPEIAFRDTSDASIAAGLELARAKWGNEVTIRGSADFKERALRLAVERGIHVNNPELQVRQRELVVERECTRSHDRELLRERSRDRSMERDGPDMGRSR